MYQGWESSIKTVECACGEPREVRDVFIGYQLSTVFVKSRLCPKCKKYYRPGDL